MISKVGEKNGFSHFLKTKIVATIGPASSGEETLRKMIRGGMSVARLNFSHGAYADHEINIMRIRKIAAEEDKQVAILQDLCGPKIRLSQMEEPVILEKDREIKLAVDKSIPADLYTDFQDLPKLVKAEDTLLLDDGYIELTVLETAEKHIVCRVKVPGTAKSKKGINLPDIAVSIEVFTEKDKSDLIFGLENKVDMVAMSFVESAKNLEPIKRLMKRYHRTVPVIAKIERPVALKNIEDIVREFDGIMIARGDLGVELPPEEVPVIQKKLIEIAERKNKLIITATQMLESMMSNPRPTRAEATDVSNAILDGTDAVMLSGETAVGKYPAESVGMMKRIALVTENSKFYQYCLDREKGKFSHTEAIVKSAAEMAKDLKANCIMVFTQSGHTALLLSKYRPVCPILAFTPHREVVRKMFAYWGVSPHQIDFTQNTDEMIRYGEEHGKEEKIIQPGDLVVTVAGVTRMKGATNMVRVSKIS